MKTIRSEMQELNRNNVRLQTIGRLEDLPFLARQGMLQAINYLENNTGLTLILALSYSSRRELTDAVREIVARAERGELSATDVDEQLISNHLYTASLPDPDLLIRTSGELRLSNFLLWQLAYTEIFVTSTFWPEFRAQEFLLAIRDYQNRERRFGKVSEQIQQEKPAKEG